MAIFSEIDALVYPPKTPISLKTETLCDFRPAKAIFFWIPTRLSVIFRKITQTALVNNDFVYFCEKKYTICVLFGWLEARLNESNRALNSKTSKWKNDTL